MSKELALEGFFLKHNTFGIGKVVELNLNLKIFNFKIFETNEIKRFTAESLKSFTRYDLVPGSCVESKGEILFVIKPLESNDTDTTNPPKLYSLKFQKTGLTVTKKETILNLVNLPNNDIIQNVINKNFDEFSLFAARENLSNQLAKLSNQVNGLRSILSARIDLHPHQSFVAANIILDPVRRFILADEVGLGKTIEAGVVIHDLISRKPHAKILILTPSSLSRQWFFEMHSSFGGKNFKLGDLHPFDTIKQNQNKWNKLIFSNEKSFTMGKFLLNIQWDLIVIDEVHHLINFPNLFNFYKKLSLNTKDILLLSAIPMKRRETELFSILTLLEPTKYKSDSEQEQDFLLLYNEQKEIGRRINLLNRSLSSEEIDFARIDSLLNRLLQTPIINKDSELQESLKLFSTSSDQKKLEISIYIRDKIIDRYRINRRIFRNRRDILIDNEKIEKITRKCIIHEYEPDQIEEYANKSVITLLKNLAKKPIHKNLLYPFSKIILQSMINPKSSLDVLDTLHDVLPAPVKEDEIKLELINASNALFGVNWLNNFKLICSHIKKYIDNELLRIALKENKTWLNSKSSQVRLNKLVECINEKINTSSKIIIFVGFPELVHELHKYLINVFDKNIIEIFFSEQDDNLKEEAVRKFRDDKNVLILLSDESGGEGRNFQFAESLYHYDLPWDVSILEQRIGRLDRLKRENYHKEVVSHVLLNSFALEHPLMKSYIDGYKIFDSSISGLEFTIKKIEDNILDTVLNKEYDDFYDLAPEIENLIKDERIMLGDETLLDEASFKISANEFRYSQYEDIEDSLSKAFTDYFCAISSPKSFWIYKENYFFRPDDITYGLLENIERDQTGVAKKREGTFNREKAQNRLDLEFFTFGNPFFDAVCNSLTRGNFGKTFSISVLNKKEINFQGIELIIILKINEDLNNQLPSLVNLSEYIFKNKRYSLFLPFNKQNNFEKTELEDLKIQVLSNNQELQVKKLSVNEIDDILSQNGIVLETFMNESLENDLPKFKNKLKKDFEENLFEEVNRLKFHQNFLINQNRDYYQNEIQQLDFFVSKLLDWDIEIDSIGLWDIGR